MHRRVSLVAGGLVIVVASLHALPAAQGPASQPANPAPAAATGVCNITTKERIVAVGDVHGAHDNFVAILRAAALIDRRDRWSGGKSVFVQTGDVLDRGPASRRSVDLLRRLEREARSAGGQVIALAGNHEFMRLVGDWRYVSPEELNAFRTADSNDLRDATYARAAAAAEERARVERRPFNAREYREQFMRDIPLGYIEMRSAFGAAGEYGNWVRSRPAVARVNGILFLHGGISDATAALGCGGVNERVAADMKAPAVDQAQVAATLSGSETGPLWYRGLAQAPEDEFAPTLESILSRMGGRAIVVGHTPSVGKITTRFGGRVVQIDSGMLNGTFFPGGVPSALEIQGGTWTAIYLNRREPIAGIPTS